MIFFSFRNIASGEAGSENDGRLVSMIRVTGLSRVDGCENERGFRVDYVGEMDTIREG